jgi:hypothetical protein
LNRSQIFFDLQRKMESKLTKITDKIGIFYKDIETIIDKQD